MALARKGHDTLLWDADASHIARLAAERRNDRHMQGIAFPAALRPLRDCHPLPEEIGRIVIAAPCDALRAVLRSLQPYRARSLKLCMACKGLEPKTLRLNHSIAAECLPDAPVAVLSGPSFAREVAEGLPTAVTIAATERQTAAEFAALFHSEVFRVYTHDDVVGAEVGGAVKNVMAIAAGVADGLRFGANARAALIARGLAEITRLGIALGGRAETFTGLAGLGDLVLTCTDDQSRNRRFGLALAAGKTAEQARRDIGETVEGLRTARVVCELAARRGIAMPISEQVLQIIDGEVSPRQAVTNLLTRDRKEEGGGG